MKKIFIVDDDTAILDVMKIILEDKGYKIEALENGIGCFSKIEKEKPDLLLLDNWLPDVMGGEIVKKLKQNKNTKNIPVIIISANHDIKRITKESGADGWLAKPFEIEDLFAILNNFL